LLWEQGVGGSNPLAPTIKSTIYTVLWGGFFVDFGLCDPYVTPVRD